jgi:hypothetical protein
MCKTFVFRRRSDTQRDMDLVELYCSVNDFWKTFKRDWDRHLIDTGYISSHVFNRLLNHGLELFTSIRSTMKPKLMKIEDKILLRKRSLIETVNDQLKNISQIEHTRHRSIGNFFINLIAGIAAYCHQPKKPSLHMQLCSLAAA